MIFSKKHYEAIAKVLNTELNKIQGNSTTEENYRMGLDQIRQDLADMFEMDNENFDWNKFKEEVQKVK